MKSYFLLAVFVSSSLAYASFRSVHKNLAKAGFESVSSVKRSEPPAIMYAVLERQMKAHAADSQHHKVMAEIFRLWNWQAWVRANPFVVTYTPDGVVQSYYPCKIGTKSACRYRLLPLEEIEASL